MAVSNRQPGIYFHTASPATVTDLPRMDVAGFVGFASNGPLHVPVLIEEFAQYRDIFGGDIVLAWDPQLKRMQHSLLGSSVESFFRNGGQRCWVVRVAADGEQVEKLDAAQLAQFTVPGLYRTDDLSSTSIHARSPGNWAQSLRLGSRLNIQTLAANSVQSQDSPNVGLLSKSDNEYRLRLVSLPADVQAGDLVELRCGQQGVRAYLFVQSLQPDDSGMSLIAKEVYWFDADADPENLPAPLDETQGMELYEEFINTSPEQTPIIRWLRFDLLVWRGEALQSQLNDLAFHPTHPHFWGYLPNDQQLYGKLLYSNPVGRQPAFNRLLEDIINPRFALACEDNPNQGFLPLNMGISSLSTTAVEPRYEDVSPPIVESAARDGLASFSADLFLDKDLAELGLASLMTEANHQRFVERRRLRGIYSLIGIDEISMIAVPDMLHRHWDKSAPEFDSLLNAPDLKPVAEADKHGMHQLEWSPVTDVRRYIVQQSLYSDFEDFKEFRVERSSPLQLDSDHEWPEAPEPNIKLSFAQDCTRHYYFRVRAEAYGQFSPWSNTRAMRLPPANFYQCERPDPASLDLKLSLLSLSDQGIRFSWQPPENNGQAFDLGKVCQFQVATDMDFVAAETTDFLIGDAPVISMEVEVPPVIDKVAYFRVRVLNGDIEGPWSNTLGVNPNTLSILSLNAPDDYDDQDLKAIQIALIRLCAARADTLAILCLPAHYQDAEIATAMDDLLPRSRLEVSASGFGSGECSVSSLNIAEQGSLSYAALYSPWLRMSAQDNVSYLNDGENVVLVPAAGAVCGKLAATTNLRGAWIASENKILQDVLGLAYRSTQDMQASLADKQVNVITATPKGFVVSRGSTLSRNSELRPLNVRRLMLLLRRLAMREGSVYVFEPNGVDFRNRVQHFWDRLLNNLYRRGAFRGNTAEAAYRVITDESVNDRRSLELGRFVVDLQVSPSQPMSFIHIRLVQNGSDQLLFQEL